MFFIEIGLSLELCAHIEVLYQWTTSPTQTMFLRKKIFQCISEICEIELLLMQYFFIWFLYAYFYLQDMLLKINHKFLLLRICLQPGLDWYLKKRQLVFWLLLLFSNFNKLSIKPSQTYTSKQNPRNWTLDQVKMVLSASAMIITLNKLANTNRSISFGIVVKDRKKNVARPKSYALADGLEVLPMVWVSTICKVPEK